MKVLLCGEGPHEIGYEDRWDERRRNYVTIDGWMQPIVRKAVPGQLEFSTRRRSELQVLPRDPNKLRLPAGHGTKAYLGKRAGAVGGYDVVIFMVDADSNHERDYSRIVAEIEAGFALVDSNIYCVACVPMAASESWLMADPNAWLVCAEYEGAALPARPEEIWGARDDPQSNHPHRLFYRVCEAAGLPDNVETRAQIAEVTNLIVARGRCPISMGQFIAALEAI